MTKPDLKSMSIPELWDLYERIRKMLPARLAEDKARIDRILRQLQAPNALKPRKARGTKVRKDGTPRRPYPPVVPKYRNPADHSQMWSGRGKQPRWLVAELKAGKKIEQFRIGRGRKKV